MNKRKVQNNKILFIILSIATILIALVGVTFAFFTAIVNNVNGEQSIMLTTQTIKGIKYEAKTPIVLPNALPGASTTSNFTITNPNMNADAAYTMDLVTDLNEFVNTDGDGQLLITISGGQLKDKVTLDMTDGTNKEKRPIGGEMILKANSSESYIVNVEFVELNKSQNSNKDKNFAAHIEVTQSIVTKTTD